MILCWLALLLVRVIENAVGRSWDLIRDELEEIHRAKVFNKDGVIELTSRLNEAHENTLNALQVRAPRRIHAVKNS